MYPRPLASLGAASLILASAHAQLPPFAQQMMLASRLPLLIREDVAVGLGLAPTQKEQINQILSDGVPKGKMPNMGLFAGMIRGKIRGKIRETESKCLAVLSPSQQTRFGELEIQALGYCAVYRSEVRKGLKTNSAQNRLIDQTRKQSETKDPSGRSFTDSEKQALAAILTPEQRTALVTMGGKPYTFGKPIGSYAVLPGGEK